MKILLAIDYSHCSKDAIDSLRDLVCARDTELHILHVAEPDPSGNPPEIKDLRDAKRFVKNTVATLSKNYPHCRMSDEVVVGTPARKILETAEEFGAELIVMGTHGRNRMSRLMLGSVSREVMLHAKCGVRLAKKPATSSKISYNVLVATNDSFESDFAFDQILTSAWPANTVFHCITVVDGSGTPADCQRRQLLAGSWLKCCAVRLNIKFTPLAVTSEILIGEPRKAIVERARQWPADLIILGSRAQTALGRMVRGSTSEAVSVNAPCSVEVMPVPKPLVKYVHVGG